MPIFFLALPVGAALLLVAAASFRDPAYHVERSLFIRSSPEKIYAILSHFEQFRLWSPWEEHDPQMKKRFQGEPGQPGHRYEWEGNGKVGAGSMTVTEAVAERRIGMDLEFLRPFPNRCQAAWSVEPEGAGSQVTWSMDGRRDSLGMKVFGLLASMDRLIGPDFERGLSKLKTVCEQA